jgi:phosphatidate phosphatase APP1
MPLNSPIITGDVSGGLHSTKVEKLQNQNVSATAPTSGQTLVWSGTAWTPATPSGGGGGGANGLTYYLNQNTNADAPTTNLPGTPKQLGRSADATQSTAASGTLTRETWTQFAGFVTESTPQDPGSIDIPAGLWDFNVWLVGVADNNHSNSVRAKVFKYDGSTAPTLLATSAAVTIGTVAALVSISVLVPETPMLVTDRIFITLEAYATGNGHSVTGQFGNNTPSHVHTSLGLVAGTGLWKNVAGVLQTPASLLVDADVASEAAIAQSKIDGLTNALANVPTPGTYLEFFEQFMATVSLSGNLAFGVTGGSNSMVNSGFGVVAMSTGATASANQQSRLTQAANSLLIGNSAARAIFRVGQSGTTWFDGTLTGAFRCGWGDSITGESANGMYFRVQNGQAIEFVTKAANIETATATGVSFSPNAFRSLEIVINAAGSEIVAKIDGAIVATHTTNIPAARIIFFAHINRTAATGTAVVANVDFVYSRITPNTPYFV